MDQGGALPIFAGPQVIWQGVEACLAACRDTFEYTGEKSCLEVFREAREEEQDFGGVLRRA